MASKQASLILSLIDQVSGPAKGVAATLGRLDAAITGLKAAAMAPGRALAGAARGMRNASMGVGVLSTSLAFGASAAARSIYEYEKLGNALEAVGLLTEDQRARMEKFGQSLNEKYPFTNNEIMQAAVELGKAGMTIDQQMGALASTLNLALAGDVPLADAASYLVRIATAMRLPMETAAEIEATMKRVADTIAYGAAESLADVEGMGTTMAYVAPLATATGQSIEELTAMTMALADAGIEGSSAGTGLRFMLLRLLNPSKAASKALARLNIDVADYVTGARKVTGQEVVDLLKMDGVDATGLEGAIDQALNDPAISKSPAKLAGRLSAVISEALGADSLVDKDALASNLNEILTVLGTQIDVRALMRAFKDNPESEGLFGQIFGAHHASKIMTLLVKDLDASLEKMEKEYVDAADRMSKIRMKGVVGDWIRLRAAVDNFTIGLSDIGVLETIVSGIRKVTEAVTDLGNVNPRILEFSTYGALTVAAIAPLGFAISGMASALALAVNPLSWVVAGLGYLAYQNWDSLIAFGQNFKLGFLDNLDPATVTAFRDLATGLGGWMGDINTALADTEGMGGKGFWTGSWLANELNAAVRDFEKFKAEINAIQEWWSNFKAEMNRPLGDVLYDYVVPNAWKDGPVPKPGEAGYQLDADEYASEARTAAARAENALAITATPVIDTSSIDAAIAKAGTLRRMLQGMDALAGGGSAAPSNGLKFGGPRAEGGPVKRGLTYLVGEEGPEFFTPGRSGGITPNGGWGGGGGITQNNTFHVSGADPRSIAADIGRILDRMLERSRQLSLDGRPVM